MCCGCSYRPKSWEIRDPRSLLCGFLRHRFSAQGFVTSLLPLHPSALWGYRRERVLFGKSCFLCSWGSSSPGWLWALSSICIPAVGIISGAEPEGGHTLCPFPLGPLWEQLPFHFCFIGLLKGCQLDIGTWGFFSAAVCREQAPLWSHLALATASSFSR